MSYNLCTACGRFWGVVNTTVYQCDCHKRTPMTVDEFAKVAGAAQREHFRKRLVELRQEIREIEAVYPEFDPAATIPRPDPLDAECDHGQATHASVRNCGCNWAMEQRMRGK